MSDTDRLHAIQQEVNQILEERVADLLARMKAVREVTAQVASADIEAERHEATATQLEAGLAKASSTGQKLEILQKVESMREAAGKARARRDELVEHLAGLASALRAPAE